VYIKFKLVPASLKGAAKKQLGKLADKPVYLLAWTTTPWTLPGNTALAVAADAEYAVVEVEDGYLILASARLMPTGLEQAPVAVEIKGSNLVGLRYEPLYNPFDFEVPVCATSTRATQTSLDDRKKQPGGFSYPVIAGDFVSMEDGTGMVHIAPAFGEVDFEAGEANNLDFVQPVDLQGKMTGKYPFSGKFVKAADPVIMADLKSRGLLYRRETIRHTYPFCWRCGTPLLYYAKQSWYIKTTAVKDSLIAGNNDINWYPEHIKHGRFGDWLENNVDWAFSRERYWGTPLPVWRCESCRREECIGGVAELKTRQGLHGLKEPMDLHRPFVDDVIFDCPDCGAKMRRLTEVIDCWFDSGAMPVAQEHYPFENATLLTDGRFPADYICEAVDQTRGWFYSLHAISTLLFNKPCYRNVICLGLILDAKGEKMSKAKGNVVEPSTVINKYGADALRWYFFTAAPPGNVRRFDEKQVAEITRRFFSTLWNVYSFFVTYANIDRFVPGAQPVTAAPSELDRWLISELNQLIADVDSSLENYDPTGAGRKIEDFVDYLSNWYVRRGRRRFWKSENDADKLSAYTTLYQCLVTLAKLMAPFTPFLAEELYQNLVRSAPVEATDSIHLTDFPVADTSKVDRELSADIRLVMKVSSLGRAARSQGGIKVRQPLARLFVKVSSGQRSTLKRLEAQVLEEVNVKALELVDNLPAEQYPVVEEGGVTVMLDTQVSP
ncbi:MAG: isoleucine--tRNA ligase, partial [Chloroflexota bacterium]